MCCRLCLRLGFWALKRKSQHPIFVLGLALWSVDSPVSLPLWKAFLDCPHQEAISALSELEGHFGPQ